MTNMPAYHAIRRRLVLRSRLAGLTDAIAGTAQGMNQFDPELAVDLGAQAADMGLDHAGARIEMKVPDVLEQHGSSDQLLGIAHEVFEQFEFLRLQLDQLSSARHGALQAVELQVGHL